MTVRLLASDRPPTTLGTVGAGRSRTFEYRQGLLAGTYVLTGQVPDGREARSRPFTLYPGAYVTWSLNNNTIWTGYQGEE